MKVYLEIIGLETGGDDVRVSCQGSAKHSADWRPMLTWRFSVPEHIGKHYKLGQRLIVDIKGA